MTDLSSIVITTERLTILPTREEYAEAIFKELTPGVAKYLSFDPSGKMEDTIAYIRSSQAEIKNGKEMPVVILDRVTKHLIGGGGIHNLTSSKPKLGIWIKLSAQGNGYGREAVEAFMEWLKENIQYEYIVYPVAKVNGPSRKLIEGLGGIVGEEKIYTSPSGKILDEVEYRIYKK